MADQDWKQRGRCAETDPESFFPDQGGTARPAKQVCQGCEVIAQCLQYALTHDEKYGVWGGMSERERNRLKKSRRLKVSST